MIPANDDASKSISKILEHVGTAIQEGLEERNSGKDKEETQEEAEAVVEETPVEETVAEETPVEETAVEEVVADETPTEEKETKKKSKKAKK